MTFPDFCFTVILVCLVLLIAIMSQPNKAEPIDTTLYISGKTIDEKGQLAVRVSSNEDKSLVAIYYLPAVFYDDVPRDVKFDNKVAADTYFDNILKED